jgi:hypothetical protein
MELYLLIALGVLLLLLVAGAFFRGLADTGSTAAVWVNALRNVVIAIVVALVVLAALPILEAALS